jgi:hypothetical protein
VVEGRSDHPTNLLLDNAVPVRSGSEHTQLGVSHDVSQGLLVGRKEHRLSAPVGQRPGNADALRGAEGGSNPATAQAIFASIVRSWELILSTASSRSSPLRPAVSALIRVLTCSAHAAFCARGVGRVVLRRGGPGPSRAPGRGARRSLGCRFEYRFRSPNLRGPGR